MTTFWGRRWPRYAQITEMWHIPGRVSTRLDRRRMSAKCRRQRGFDTCVAHIIRSIVFGGGAAQSQGGSKPTFLCVSTAKTTGDYRNVASQRGGGRRPPGTLRGPRRPHAAPAWRGSGFKLWMQQQRPAGAGRSGSSGSTGSPAFSATVALLTGFASGASAQSVGHSGRGADELIAKTGAVVTRVVPSPGRHTMAQDLGGSAIVRSRAKEE